MQALVDGAISPQEFKALARNMASPEMLRRAYGVLATSDGYALETRGLLCECLPRLKREHGLLKIIPIEITLAEAEKILDTGECPVDALRRLEAEAEAQGITREELEQQSRDYEAAHAVLY